MPIKIRPAARAPRRPGTRRSTLAAACALALVGAAALAGCDAARQQDAFADAAGRVPTGYAEFDALGTPGASRDDDDWRTAPVYAGRLSVKPIYPNPTRGGEPVTLEITVLTFEGGPGALAVRARNTTGRLVTLDEVRTSGPGVYALSFASALLQGAGLRRVFVFDALGELVSYGDVLVE